MKLEKINTSIDINYEMLEACDVLIFTYEGKETTAGKYTLENGGISDRGCGCCENYYGADPGTTVFYFKVVQE